MENCRSGFSAEIHEGDVPLLFQPMLWSPWPDGLLYLAVQGFVGDVPDIRQTDARVEVVEELEWKEGVHEEQPGHGAEEGELGVLERHGLRLHRPENPGGYVADDQEGESSTPRHVLHVLLLRRISSHSIQDLDDLHIEWKMVSSFIYEMIPWNEMCEGTKANMQMFNAAWMWGRGFQMCRWSYHMYDMQGRHFNFFLGGKFFLDSSMPPDYWKIGKNQNFICSNLTLFIVPIFLSFFLFFLIFSFFFSFSLGATASLAPSNDAPDDMCKTTSA